MKKKKSILILLAVFVVLLLIAFIIEGPISKRGRKKAAEESVLFPEFDADQVSSVEIKTKSRQDILIREGEQWLVATSDNYPADQQAIEDLMSKVKDLKATLTASKSADKHSQFEVDEEKGVEIKMLGPKESVPAHFFIGKMGPDFTSTYVRRADDDKVFLVDGYLRSIDKGQRGWRDRTIFDFASSQVQRLTMVSPEKGEIALESQEDGNWQIIKPEVAPANKDTADKIANDISGLSADDFAEKKDLKEYELDEPKSKVMVDLKDGTARVLLIGNMSGQRYNVKREDKETVFLLSKAKVEDIFKGLEDLKATAEESQETQEQPSTEPQATP